MRAPCRTVPTKGVISLRFGAGAGSGALSLSGAASVGEYLFLAPDEGASLVRLRRSGDAAYGDAISYPVADFVDTPGDAGDELDLEGMDIGGGYLWLAGSHSAVRTRVRDQTPPGEVPGELAAIRQPKARTLLARIPLSDSPAGPSPVVTSASALGELTAARLSGGGRGLLDLLRRDEHLGPFAGLPGKDNGLDIEGLAVVGPRILLGLRGPVLRGWAVLLELEPRPDRDNPHRLQLAPMGDGNDPASYRKHFADLAGLGIRDLARNGDDLLLLAGPTMLLDGPSRILQIPGGAVRPLPAALHRSDLIQLGPDLPVGDGADHPEAITVIPSAGPPPQGLVAYDSPSRQRRQPDGVVADVVPLTPHGAPGSPELGGGLPRRVRPTQTRA
jgi:Protein of unknown function (DUF3616)